MYLAHDPDLARNIAIKVLPPAFATDKERVRRLHREGRAASALNMRMFLRSMNSAS